MHGWQNDFVFANSNPVYRAVVLEAMKKIDCHTMIYPCTSVQYDERVGRLIEYTVRKSEYRRITQNSNFFGDLIPPPMYEIPEGELPHYCYEDVDIDVEFTSRKVMRSLYKMESFWRRTLSYFLCH